MKTDENCLHNLALILQVQNCFQNTSWQNTSQETSYYVNDRSNLLGPTNLLQAHNCCWLNTGIAGCKFWQHTHILNTNNSTIFQNILASKLSTTPKIFSGRNRWFPTLLLAFRVMKYWATLSKKILDKIDEQNSWVTRRYKDLQIVCHNSYNSTYASEPWPIGRPAL
jgi:hypothetical protein